MSVVHFLIFVHSHDYNALPREYSLARFLFIRLHSSRVILISPKNPVLVSPLLGSLLIIEIAFAHSQAA
jgi:hypothetical protein